MSQIHDGTERSLPFFVVGGTLDRDAPSYVPREADEELFINLTHGRFCYVLTSRQMGKSSLMVRTAARLRGSGSTAIVLDLTEIGQNLTVEQWYRGLLSIVGEQTGLDSELSAAWRGASDLGPMQRWVRAIREVVLPSLAGEVVIFVDEIDAVRSLPFSTDEFFAGIRELYNRRYDSPELNRLTFCLLGVASPSDLVRETRTTPFNIGARIVLNDFTTEEAQPLARGLGDDRAVSAVLLDRVLYWTSGHPYLTQRLCHAVAADRMVQSAAAVDVVCQRLFLSPAARESDDNLLFVRDRILRSDLDLAELLGLYRRIRAGERIRVDESNPLITVLRLSGIVCDQGGVLTPRNRIYASVFDDAWARENLPAADVRRQKRAFKRGILRSAAIAAVAIGLMAYLVYDATTHRRTAETAQQTAEHEKGLNRRLLYVAHMNLAYQSLDRGDYGRVSQILEQELPEPDKGDERGFEYYYLWRQMHAEEKLLHVQSAVNDMRYSPDGQVLVTADGSGVVSFRDAQSGAIIRQTESMLSPAYGLTFSPDGRAVTAVTGQGEVRVIDRATAKFLRTIKSEGVRLQSAAYAPDGRLVAAGFASGSINVVDPDTGAVRSARVEGNSTNAGVGLSPDGATLIVGDQSGYAAVWDTAGMRERYSIRDSKRMVHTAEFSPDSTLLALGLENGDIEILEVASGRTITSIKSGNSATMRFSSDGTRLAIGTLKSTVNVYDVATGARVAWFPGHTEAVFAVAFSRDGRTIVSGAPDNTIRFWDVTSSGREPQVLTDHRAEVYSVRFSHDGSRLASGSFDGVVIIHDLAGARPPIRIQAHNGRARAVAFSPDDATLASCGDDGRVRLWDAMTGAPVWSFELHTDQVFSISFSPDGKLLASGSFDHTVRVWDLATRTCIKTFDSPDRRVECVSFSPDGSQLAAGGESLTVRVWDTRTWELVRTLEGHTDWTNAITYSADGQFLASAGSYTDATARVWNAATGAPVYVFRGFGATSGFGAGGEITPSGRANCLAFYPGGSSLALGTVDRTVKLFDMLSGEEMHTLSTGHELQIYSIAFSPDGTMLATASADTTIRLFRAARPEEVFANR